MGKNHLTGASMGMAGEGCPEVPRDAMGHPMVCPWIDRRRGVIQWVRPTRGGELNLKDFGNWLAWPYPRRCWGFREE